MNAVITYQSSDGTRRRCDARCYNATTRKCTCICGGRNHGVGKQQALKNNEQHCKQLRYELDDIAPDDPHVQWTVKTLPPENQTPLFPCITPTPSSPCSASDPRAISPTSPPTPPDVKRLSGSAKPRLENRPASNSNAKGTASGP